MPWAEEGELGSSKGGEVRTAWTQAESPALYEDDGEEEEGEAVEDEGKMLMTSIRKMHKSGFSSPQPVSPGPLVQGCRQSRFPFGSFRTVPWKGGEAVKCAPNLDQIHDVNLWILHV